MTKRFSLWFVWIGLCSAAILAQSAAPATGSVAGRITVKQQPLPGITVTLEAPAMEPSQPPRKTFSTKTDGDGRYRFNGVPKGQHVVSPRAAAYVVPTGGVMIRAGKDVTIGENEQLDGIDFDLTRGGVITGKITDHTGRPMIQQRVTLKTRSANDRWQNYFSPNYSMHQTDDRGVFRLYGLSAGQYLVSVGEGRNDGTSTLGRAGGYLPLTYYPGTLNEAEAKVIELTEGGDVTDVDIRVGKPEKTYEVRGRIIDGTTGAPMIGVQFSISARSDQMSSSSTSGERTNAQGEFLLQGIKPGKYGVSMMPERNSEYYSDETAFELLDDDAEGLEVKAYRGASINGIVVIEGTNDPALLQRVKDVRISAFSTTPARQAPRPLLATNPDGTFQLTGVRPGKTQLSAQPRPPLQLLRIERDGVEMPSEFELTAGEQITGVKVVLGYGTGVIRGQVQVVGGALPTSARFLVVGRNLSGARAAIMGPNGNVQVDTRGKFLVEHVMPGEYELQLVPLGMPGAPPMQSLRAVPQKVTVGLGETTVTFTINLGEKKEGQQ